MYSFYAKGKIYSRCKVMILGWYEVDEGWVDAWWFDKSGRFRGLKIKRIEDKRDFR